MKVLDLQTGNIIFLIHFAATLMMVGIIWFVQIVHYPLFGKVGGDKFREYEKLHTQQTGRIVGPLMILELFSGVILLWLRPVNVPVTALWAGLILLLIIWASTFFIQVPLHRQLIKGFDKQAHRRLLQTNWVRTIAWSLRGIVLFWGLVARN